MAGLEDAFSVNGFMFCTTHGGELCNDCGADYRMGNNHQVDREKVKASAAKGYKLDDRPALRAFYLGAVYSGRQRDGGRFGIFQCREHKQDDCEDCFNWTNILIEQSQKKDLEGKVYGRNDLLGLLRSMGVELPADTKLLEDLLDQKLGNALTMSQKLDNVSLPVNPSQLRVWKGKAAHQVMGRTSPGEAMKKFSSLGLNPFPLYVNTWMDARQTVMHLARNFESGAKVMVLQDEKDHNEAISIRVLNIHKLDDETPVVALLYCSTDLTGSPSRTLDWFQAQMRTGSLAQVTCTPQEQALLRKLLFQNSRRISSDFKPHKESYERHFKTSFVLPLNPLSEFDIGKLVHNTGCQICGQKTISRCSQCQSASYCGPACQRDDWKSHKALCKALQGGTWATLKISNNIVINGQKMYTTSISNSGPLKAPNVSQIAKQHDDDAPPPNVHSEQPFLVKVQRPPTPGGPQPEVLLIYDRQRSFKVYAMREDNVVVYAEAKKQIEIRNNRSKVYRWAKRSGDWTLDVCLDRIPEPEPTW